MNCKQGDLAIVVRANNPANLGKLVTCLEFIPDKVFTDPDGTERPHQAWLVDVEMTGFAGDKHYFIEDFKLLPLRDSDGQDETLTWAGLPKKKGVKA